nr:Similarity to tr [Ipomoea batatas]
MITLSPGSVSTMSEAPLAASVASATAIPISAFFKAGASFTPSPVIPTIHSLGDGALLGQLVGSNSHCDRQNSGHGNRDATDQEHEQIVNSIPVLPVLNWVHHNNLGYHAHSNGAYTEVPNGSEDFLEVPDLVEPEKTSSPGCLVTGRDSPVRAD